jgi:hypothetical protein
VGRVLYEENPNRVDFVNVRVGPERGFRLHDCGWVSTHPHAEKNARSGSVAFGPLQVGSNPPYKIRPAAPCGAAGHAYTLQEAITGMADMHLSTVLPSDIPVTLATWVYAPVSGFRV